MIHPTVQQIVQDIRDIKIQGAQRIAQEGLRAFVIAKNHAYDTYTKKDEFVEQLEITAHMICSARPTEPLLRNVIRMVWAEGKDMNTINSQMDKNIAKVKDHFTNVHTFVPEHVFAKLAKHDSIYTHCHSSNVVDSLLFAVAKGKTITVHNTETRPLLQGRITAIELARHKIPVSHYPDSAMRIAIKASDIVLLGCDAIDSRLKIYNKIGSELVCEAAKALGKPVYIVTDSWKYDPLNAEEVIADRDDVEVWADAPKGVQIINFAFEKINPDLVRGIICEFGVFTPREFEHELRTRYPALFEKKVLF